MMAFLQKLAYLFTDPPTGTVQNDSYDDLRCTQHLCYLAVLVALEIAQGKYLSRLGSETCYSLPDSFP